MLTLTCKELPTLLYTSRSRKKIQNLCTKVRLRQALYTSCETHTIVLMPRFDVNNFSVTKSHQRLSRKWKENNRWSALFHYLFNFKGSSQRENMYPLKSKLCYFQGKECKDWLRMTRWESRDHICHTHCPRLSHPLQNPGSGMSCRMSEINLTPIQTLNFCRPESYIYHNNIWAWVRGRSAGHSRHFFL